MERKDHAQNIFFVLVSHQKRSDIEFSKMSVVAFWIDIQKNTSLSIHFGFLPLFSFFDLALAYSLSRFPASFFGILGIFLRILFRIIACGNQKGFHKHVLLAA